MKNAVAEISKISESLDDAEWQRIINYPHSRSKLRAKIREIEKNIAEGKTELMDFKRLSRIACS